MKAVLVFMFALFCFTSIQCSFIPSWQDCEDHTGLFPGWNTTNLTLDKRPVPGQSSTAAICVENLDTIEWDTTEVLTYAPGYIDVYFLDKTSLKKGESHCWNVTFPIPEKAPQDLTVKLLFQNKLLSFGCAQLNLTFASHEKFLGF